MKEISNREVKSSVFTALFGNPKNAAQLYQALEAGEEGGPEFYVFYNGEASYEAEKN
ncbi:hypothetical protein GPL15_03660 [Clostridium sp. MCC353]|uniref:hypothetical protein n=1 Tax=Clostridium sp. MCC353 TaxID=2592646 RepID=UPI001C01515B|nr:hypothetical protein [Clostridium sp. MCC353]MBT9775607.1 hypothetical protein [Clostridium sp. MCC353]